MKTSILGLIAHPFSSPNKAQDFFGNPLKTPMSDVFRLSLNKDNRIYHYALNATTIDGISFSEPIRMYPRKEESRHRITVGKDNSPNLGNFLLNTSYINFKRLFPLIETSASENPRKLKLKEKQDQFIQDGYWKILGRDYFNNATPVAESKGQLKTTFGPTNQSYDFNSISSGEDNLGHILQKMFAFEEYKIDPGNRNRLQGIFCIDEIEAGLHPIAQENFFNFILKWSLRNRVQVVATTHSLYLIQHALSLRENENNKENINVNMISTAFVSDLDYNIILNPTYNEAYKELTFKDFKDLENSYKINILCEDNIAEDYIKKIIKNRELLSRLNFITNLKIDTENSGNSCNILRSLSLNGERLLLDSIIIYDPDVSENYLKDIKASTIILPSINKLPIEVETAKFIYDLPGGHVFFTSLNKAKDSFINDFSNSNIRNLDKIEQLRSNRITRASKNWANSDIHSFKKYITKYVEYNHEIFSSFKNSFVSSINSKLIAKSLPIFTKNI